MTTGSSPWTRDQALVVMRRLAAGGAITGLTFTGALTGLLARADVSADPAPAAAPAHVAVSQPGTPTQLPRRVLIVVEESAGRGRGPARAGQPARLGTAESATVQRQSRPAPAPAVRAPQQQTAPAATSSGSSAP
jgi:hypothetical protein